MDLLGVGDRLFGAAQVGFGDDLQQRGTGAVEIDAGHAGELIVEGFAGILFQMGAGHADALMDAVLQFDIDMADTDDGVEQLAGLVALG